MDVSTQKAEIRSRMLDTRDAMDVDQRISKSIDAAQMTHGEILFHPGTIISAFLPIRSEIDPRPLMDILRKNGAILCLPVTINNTTIVFREFARDGTLVDAGFGTYGPGPEARELNPQIILMPLAVFDNMGGRIGYGAGHYDRAIAKLIKRQLRPQLIGMAFECQRFENLPQMAHDIRLDAIVTECGLLRFKDIELDY